MKMVWGSYLHPELLAACQKRDQWALITDANLDHLVAKPLLHFLQHHEVNVSLHVFPAGEIHKTRATKERLENELLKKEMGRGGGIIALGGGVVHDVAGFVAATYCRGIPLMAIPTTLMAAVDAAIGGKNGVNVPEGKNRIGSFHIPEMCLLDLTLLQKLPSKEIRNGVAEMLKHGLIADRAHWEALRRTKNPLQESLIRESQALKLHVIGDDWRDETGARGLLNFGHTIAHALEKISDYRMPHGEAVALGCVAECYLSGFRGPLLEEVMEGFRFHGFGLKIVPQATPAAMQEAIRYDKKRSHGKIKLTLLDAIGKPHPGDHDLGGEELTETLNWVYHACCLHQPSYH